MFKNVGQQVKTLAKIIFGVGLVDHRDIRAVYRGRLDDPGQPHRVSCLQRLGLYPLTPCVCLRRAGRLHFLSKKYRNRYGYDRINTPSLFQFPPPGLEIAPIRAPRHILWMNPHRKDEGYATGQSRPRPYTPPR